MCIIARQANIAAFWLNVYRDSELFYMNSDTYKNPKQLTLFSLVMITIVSVDSIRNLPATALFGSQLVFFFVMAALVFLIPCALVSAELASAFSEQGGIYVWVKEAFGQKFGFLAIWFQWIENVIWYPTILSFVAGTIGYLIAPALASNKFFLIAVILTAFWGVTIINLMGMRFSAMFSNVCATAGLLLPMTLIIALGVSWFMGDHPLQINLSPSALMPNLHESNAWVALTGIIMSFCGIEIATVHAGDVANPQRVFPRALLYSVLIIVSTLIMGSLAIAVVLPSGKISLVAGIMQAFAAFFAAYHLQWFLPLVAIMLILGGLGGVSNWIIAPTKGLLIAGKDGNLPPSLQKENGQGAPVNLLLYQAIIVTLLTLSFFMMPSVNGSYWLLTALAAQLYMFMYLLMFGAAIYLRLARPDLPRMFSVPGGNKGLCFVAVVGILGCLATIAVGFIPPANIQVGGTWHYESLLLGGLILMCLPPFLCQRFSRESWVLA